MGESLHANDAPATGRSHVPSAKGPASSGPLADVVPAVTPPASRQVDPLIEKLAIVRDMLGRLETKLREDEPDRVPKEDDQTLRGALQHIGDDRLTRLSLAYSLCVRGLTAPLPSGAWKRELAEEVGEARRAAIARLDALERLARFPVGRLWLRLRAALWRAALRSRPRERPSSPEEGGRVHRAA